MWDKLQDWLLVRLQSWDGPEGEDVGAGRRLAPFLVSLLVNVGLIGLLAGGLAISEALRPNRSPSQSAASSMVVEIVSLLPPRLSGQPSRENETERQQREREEAARNRRSGGGQPGVTGEEEAVSIGPAPNAGEPGAFETAPVVIGPPQGLGGLLGRGDCASPKTPEEQARCGVGWAERMAEAPRALAEAVRETTESQLAAIITQPNCQSAHLGCTPPSDRTLAGALPVNRERGDMRPGGPTGIGQTPMMTPNAYHVDPGFGD